MRLWDLALLRSAKPSDARRPAPSREFEKCLRSSPGFANGPAGRLRRWPGTDHNPSPPLMAARPKLSSRPAKLSQSAIISTISPFAALLEVQRPLLSRARSHMVVLADLRRRRRKDRRQVQSAQ